ncbi:hypothetical protein RND81_08G213200 [Saponaria officinalis]|uniref:RING-CH-type domain-containing protein n=1 Tax=Saponaria officinalis TaxID=3572 RepID=A0AAW1JBJ9_SAPOF
MMDIEQGLKPTHRRTSDAGEDSGDGNRRTSAVSDSSPCTVSDKNEQHKLNDSSTSSFEEVVVVVDLECGGGGGEVAVVDGGGKVKSVEKVERDCRICQLSIDESNNELGFGIELGCCCKEDLAAAHLHCAEAWFKIRGNKTCEICGSTARNVVGVNEVELMEQWNDANDTASTAAAVPPHPAETRHFWQGHKFLNFLLACMVFAFVISWLFHFNVPS